MRGSVKAPFSERSGPKEVAAFLSQVRDVLSQTRRVKRTLTTAGASADTAIFTTDVIAEGTQVNLRVLVIGVNSAGTAYYSGTWTASFYRIAGAAVTAQGSALLHAAFVSGAQTSGYEINSDSSISVKVDDDGNTMDWEAWVEVSAQKDVA